MQSLAIMREVLQVLQQSQTPQQAAQQAMETVARCTQWAHVALLEPQPSPQPASQEAPATPAFELRSDAGAQAAEADWPPPHYEELCERAWRSGEIQYTPPTVPASACAVPLKRGKRVNQLLFLAGGEDAPLHEQEQSFIETFAAALTLGLQNALVYQTLTTEVAERQEVEERLWATVHKMDTLYRVSRTLNAPGSFDEHLSAAMHQIASALRADQALLITWDTDRQCVTRFAAGGAESGVCRPPHYQECITGLLDELCAQNTPLLYPAADADLPLAAFPVWAGLTPGSLLAIPLENRRETPGLLLAVNQEGERRFNHQDRELLLAICDQITTAIYRLDLIATIEEERGRLRALVASSRDGILLLSPDLHILVINSPALRYLTLEGPPAAWVERNFWELLASLRASAPQIVKNTLAELRRLRQGDVTPAEGEYQVGANFIHWLSLPVPVREPAAAQEAHAPGRLLIFRDITESYRVEQLRNDLMHTMVHDLRNPLTGISAALKLLGNNTQDRLSKNQTQMLEIAHDNTLRLLNLVSNILEISRLESGRMPVHPVVFSLRNLIKGVLALHIPLVKQQQLTVHCALDGDLPGAEGGEAAAAPPPVWGDPELIERVLQNLIHNAIKFTPQGGTIQVQAGVSPEDPAQVQVTVSDTGRGVPDEIRERLFEKFVTGTRQGHGSGLGLAFCRMVMEAHGQRIWLVRSTSEGSTFAFTLPVAQQERFGKL